MPPSRHARRAVRHARGRQCMPFTLLQLSPAAITYMKHTCAHIAFGFPRTGNLQEVSCPGKDEKQTKKQCLNLSHRKTSVLSSCSSLPSVPVPKLRSQGAPHITKSSGSCNRSIRSTAPGVPPSLSVTDFRRERETHTHTASGKAGDSDPFPFIRHCLYLRLLDSAA